MIGSKGLNVQKNRKSAQTTCTFFDIREFFEIWVIFQKMKFFFFFIIEAQLHTFMLIKFCLFLNFVLY